MLAQGERLNSISVGKLVIADCFKHYVSYVISARKEIAAGMSWMDFDSRKQSTITISLVTSHGRATLSNPRKVYGKTISPHLVK